MKKIKAYSLVELLVVMVIGTITIAVAYQGYLLFYKQYLSFKDSSGENADISSLETLLLSDIQDSKEVKRNSTGIVCFYKDKQIFYNWSNEFITRKQLVLIDTFKIKNGDLKIKFHGSDAMENNLVDEVQFSWISEEEAFSFMFEKEYGADVLINDELRKLN
jgi:prepilin-type N-terminal cleavage/methylation domain-containing protein